MFAEDESDMKRSEAPTSQKTHNVESPMRRTTNNFLKYESITKGKEQQLGGTMSSQGFRLSL